MYTAITSLIISVALCIYCLLYSYSGKPALSPMLVPFIASIIMLVASVTLVVKEYKHRTPKPKVPLLIPILMLGAIIAYSLLLGKLHFILLSALLLVVLMYAFGERRPIWLASFSFGISASVYLLFVHFLGILLP